MSGIVYPDFETSLSRLSLGNTRTIVLHDTFNAALEQSILYPHK